jgi:CheY-like chemotaxis protein
LHQCRRAGIHGSTSGGTPDATKCLPVIRRRQPDRLPELIICDYWLTNENGLDAIERVRAAIGERVPAVLVTAETSRSVLLAAQAVGTPLLHKPVSPLKLRALLAQLLSHPDSEIRIAA